MVEARSAKPLPQALGERLLVSEDDAFDDPAPLAAKSGCDRARERSTQPVGDASKPAAAADLTPAISPQHHVDAVMS